MRVVKLGIRISTSFQKGSKVACVSALNQFDEFIFLAVIGRSLIIKSVFTK